MPKRRRRLKNFANLVADSLPASVVGKSVELWFQDEARVGPQGTLSYVWATVDARSRVMCNYRHDSIYLFGAVCPDRATEAAIIMPVANSGALAEHLVEIVCDGAG